MQILDNINLKIAKDKTILVALSGGVDSVVLSVLLVRLGYTIGLAHCNFQLRGLESEEDAMFCENLSEKLNVPYYQINFNTAELAKQSKKSIQVLARELRYSYFESLCSKYNYDYIATAHHLNDDLETSLMNWCKANVLNGAAGIPYQRGKIIRPLLQVSKKEIENFARDNQISYRQDSSNLTTKYHRNKIRHNIIPLIQEINPNIEQTYLQNKQTNLLIQQFVEDEYKAWIKKIQEPMILLFEEVIQNQLFVYKWMNEKGFTWQNFNQLIQLCKDKLSSKKILNSVNDIIWTSSKGVHFYSYQLKKSEWIISKKNITRSQLPQIFELPLNEVYVDANLITGNVYIRNWKKGDFFYPIGLKGRKKISDWFTDLKLNEEEKLNLNLLLHENDIIAIIGYRLDSRFKVDANTVKILKISWKTKM